MHPQFHRETVKVAGLDPAASRRFASGRPAADLDGKRPRVQKCNRVDEKEKDRQKTVLLFLVGVAGLEPAASWSRTKHATNCATPRYSEYKLYGEMIPLSRLFF